MTTSYMIFEGARRHCSYICLAIILGASPAVALSEEIAVGSCPSEIVVERKGEWTDVTNNTEMVEVLQANTERTNDVAAIYVVEDEGMLEAKVVSLQTLERFQGGISEADFNAIRAQFVEAFKGLSQEMQKKVDKVIEGNLSGTDLTMSHLRFEPSVSSPGKFIGFALTELNVPELGATLYETAIKMQHIRGCIVQANFAIAFSSGSRARLERAISDFVMK